MLVTPAGGRLWRFKYRHAGVEKLLTLGAYPDVSLKRAREKRDDARRNVADGIDPGVKRRANQHLRSRRRRVAVDEEARTHARHVGAGSSADFQMGDSLSG